MIMVKRNVVDKSGLLLWKLMQLTMTELKLSFQTLLYSL